MPRIGQCIASCCTIHFPHNQLSLACEEREKYPCGHGEEVKITTVGQEVGRQRVHELGRGFTRKIGKPGGGRTLYEERQAVTRCQHLP